MNLRLIEPVGARRFQSASSAARPPDTSEALRRTSSKLLLVRKRYAFAVAPAPRKCRGLSATTPITRTGCAAAPNALVIFSGM